MLQTGDHIADRFEIESLLGEGGLAQVYRVRHLNLGTAHALKLLTLTHPSLVERLLQEGRIQAQLRHPNIVAVTDVVMHQGQPGLLMEFVEGETLEAALTRGGSPPLEEALDLFSQVLAGVASAHAAGVLHRDLKPANILLARTAAGVVPKVTDFGIAKVARGGSGGGAPLTRLGVTMGTPGYMAPEQSEDASTVDARADVFALGAILYELVTGQRAFPSAGVRETLNAAASANYVPPDQLRPDLPQVVCEAIRVAMAPRADDRYPDCVSFAVALFEGQPEHLGRLMPTRGTPPPLPAFLWPRATAPSTPPSTQPGPPGTDAPPPTWGMSAAGTLNPKPATDTPLGTLAVELRAPRAKAQVIGLALLLMAIGMAASYAVLTRVRPAEPATETPGSAVATVEPAATAVEPATSTAPSPEPGAPAGEVAPPPETGAVVPSTGAPTASPGAAAVSSGAKGSTARRTESAPVTAVSDVLGATSTESSPEAPTATATDPATAEALLIGEPPQPTSGTGGTETRTEAAPAVVPDLVGAWVGEPWNLTILKMDELRVTGFIYRGASGGRLPVSGAYNPETRTLVVRDSSSSRYVLTATVRGDRLSGTYTQGEGELSSRWSAKRSR